MAGAIRHRGPDGFGLVLDPGAGLVSTQTGDHRHPAAAGSRSGRDAADGSVLVYNGEVYNHLELRAELEARRESLRDQQRHRGCPRDCSSARGSPPSTRLNGQFAFAWWQPDDRRLTLVRDRFGVRPLLLRAVDDGSIVFGSEAKALFASGEIAPSPISPGLDDVFTLWGSAAAADRRSAVSARSRQEA